MRRLIISLTMALGLAAPAAASALTSLVKESSVVLLTRAVLPLAAAHLNEPCVEWELRERGGEGEGGRHT